MRQMFLLLLALPALVSAQPNHSANELARENIMEYLSKKIFRNSLIQPVSAGEIQAFRSNESGIAWKVNYEMEVTDLRQKKQDSTIFPQPYSFTFYMDKKLRVLLAERIQYSLK